ncbi:MAG: YdhR family protein [Comamonadaceae bacterium]|nr:YdhR family protein [Comamonadaceae bacterium]
MITAIVTFALPAPMSRQQARDTFLGTAPKYQGLDGLVRKHYILSEDGRTAGGVYLWRSRAQAETAYSDEWRAFVRAKYGAPPVIAFYDTPVMVDNVAHDVWSDAAP